MLVCATGTDYVKKPERISDMEKFWRYFDELGYPFLSYRYLSKNIQPIGVCELPVESPAPSGYYGYGDWRALVSGADVKFFVHCDAFRDFFSGYYIWDKLPTIPKERARSTLPAIIREYRKEKNVTPVKRKAIECLSFWTSGDNDNAFQAKPKIMQDLQVTLRQSLWQWIYWTYGSYGLIPYPLEMSANNLPIWGYHVGRSGSVETSESVADTSALIRFYTAPSLKFPLDRIKILTVQP
jgi:hypothetical protein